MRMAVAHGDDGVTAIKVQILRAFVIPNLAALRPHGDDIEKRINVKKFHILKSRSLQLEPGLLRKSEAKIHILHCRPGGAFQQIINHRGNKEHPLVRFQG